MVKYVLENNFTSNEPIHILEPSCGDGAFLKAISQNFSEKSIFIDAIDLDSSAIEETNKLVSTLYGEYTVTNTDYLNWSVKAEKRYNLIIGNPPYISKKLLTEDQKESCKKIHAKNGDFGTEIHNIWTCLLYTSPSPRD